MTRNRLPSRVEQPVRQAASNSTFERLARLGYAAKGIVYFVVGFLALQAAFGTGGKTTDTEGALISIVSQPFGKFLLSIVTLGLIGYALWQLVQAILDPEHSGQKTDIKQGAQRLGYAFSAVGYGSLALTAAGLVIGLGGGQNNSTEDWTARLLAQPFGQWLVGLAGLIAIGVGIYNIYEAYKCKFRHHFKLQEMTAGERNLAMRTGQFGIAARGIVFGIIGIFLIQAALQSDPTEAKGLGAALATLAQQPFGPWLLGLVALGFIAYGVYSLVEGRYRRIVRPRNQR